MSEFEAYRQKANRTRKPPHSGSSLPCTLNASLGLAGEVGETVDIIKKAYFHGKVLDRNKLCDELGDVLFYLDWLAGLHGLTLQEVADRNIEKLAARYPDGFVNGGGNREEK